jgi:protein-glutamine gamma-glutamyltransferase
MRLANRRPGGIGYDQYLDPNCFDKTGWVTFRIKPGVKPSDAVDCIFRYGSGAKMECLSVMSAIYYRAILEAIGPDEFNKRFKDNMVISQHSPVFKLVYRKPPGEPLKPGDWVYVKGHPNYHDPEMNKALGPGNSGYWQGENAVVESDGTLSGLGLENETLDEMKKNLLNGYNQKVDAYNQTPYGKLHPKPHGTIDQIVGILPGNTAIPPSTF